MITTQMIREEKERYQIGEEIVIRTFHNTSTEGKKKAHCLNKFRIIDKNNRMLVCDNGRYRVTVTFAELIAGRMEGREQFA